MDAKPNCTLYVNNLNEKVKKDELRKSLYHLFSQFGAVLDIVALKTIKMRGQAFIVFKDISAASAALRSLQGCPFYDKPMKLDFALTESESIQKLRGTFKMRKAGEDGKDVLTKKKKERRPDDVSAIINGADHHFTPFADYSQGQPEQEEMPNQILFVSNLPPEFASVEMLATLFGPHPGFKEVRLVPGRQDIAFVEFDVELNATTARDALNHYRLTATNAIAISYAKR